MSASDARALLVENLVHMAAAMRADRDAAVEIAYSITGLLGTDFAIALDPLDPLQEVFAIAGELETSPPNAGKLHVELIGAIASL